MTFIISITVLAHKMFDLPLPIPDLMRKAVQDLVAYPVVIVIDGDTIKVNISGRVERIRFIGKDTPETKHPSKPVECYGPEATLAMKKLVGGKRVYLVADPTQGDRDRYGRLLRYHLFLLTIDTLEDSGAKNPVNVMRTHSKLLLLSKKQHLR